MGELRWRLGLYLHLVGARVRSQMQYRLSFSLDLIGACFISLLDFLAVVVLFAHLPRLAGWSLGQVAFFYGTANISFALADLFVGHLDLFPAMVRQGTFDLVLVRPAGALFQVLSSDLALRRLGRVAQGLAVLAYALVTVSVPWNVGRAVMICLMILTGVMIYASVWVIGTTVAFWTVEAREVTNAFTYGGSFLASYPVNIFGGWTRRMLAFVVPMAFVSYFPGLYVLNHSDPIGAPTVLRFCAPLVALILSAICAWVWGYGVTHYRSTGS